MLNFGCQYLFLDVDDCSPKPCSDTCQQNAAGQGYSCSCPAGKKLDVDERSCIGKYTLLFSRIKLT